jgi:DnaJ-domain-containing protein 1
MTDYFSLLGFERSPWLEPEAVNARFFELSASAHPDRVHGGGEAAVKVANQSFAELNAAAACLREPRERLKHLLELETGSKPGATQAVPSEVMDLVMRAGQTCRSVDQFMAERAKASSPIMQAQLFAQGLEWSDRVAEMQTAVNELRTKAEEEVKRITSKWPEEKPILDLQKLAHIFATVGRWEGQLKERFAALAAFA